MTHLESGICGLEGAQIASQREIIMILSRICIDDKFHTLFQVLKVLFVNWRQLLLGHIAAVITLKLDVFATSFDRGAPIARGGVHFAAQTQVTMRFNCCTD